MDKIPFLPYLEGSEDLDSKFQNGEAPNFTAESLLRSNIFGTWNKICLLFQLDFEQKRINVGKISVLAYLEG